MLVLSRRTEEKVVFPALGITVQILNIKPHQVKIGIDAPRSVTILRQELEAGSFSAGEQSDSHANLLSTVGRSLHLLEQQCFDGDCADALATVAGLKEALERLHPDLPTECEFSAHA